MVKTKAIYAVYRDDKYFFDGTAEEIADALGIKKSTVRKLATPSYQKRQVNNGIEIVKLDYKEVENENAKRI